MIAKSILLRHIKSKNIALVAMLLGLVKFSGLQTFLWTSLSFVCSVFSESTANALELFSKENSGFEETARFVKLVCNVWKIMTVRTPFQGTFFTEN